MTTEFSWKSSDLGFPNRRSAILDAQVFGLVGQC